MKRSPIAPLQAIIGAVYMAAGIGVWVILPRRMAQIAEATHRDPGSFDMRFLWFCLGLVGLLLFGGGARKVLAWYRAGRERD